mgnify:CR=1 FL=1
MTDNQEKGSSRSALRYLHYPERTLRQELWECVGEADFLGGKFISGRAAPLHFIGYSLDPEPRLRHYERVEAQTADVPQVVLFGSAGLLLPDHIPLRKALQTLLFVSVFSASHRVA